MPEKVTLLYGRDYIEEEVLGLHFQISPFSFFQTNTKSAERLYSKAREYAGDTKDKLIFDLYSGTGTIAQMLSPVASKVIGVEIVEEAVEAARENAKSNGLDNCEFIAGDVLKVIDTIEEKPDLIILDPPRDGINPKALLKIINYGVDEIVYISCKPTSLARDLDENGEECEDGMVGSICIRVDQGHPTGLFRDYWKDDAAMEKSFKFGYYNTGDTAWRDGDGYYWFVGRNDDVIKCSGYRIGPFEVESALMEHPSVLECAVTALPHPDRGQVVKATIVLAKGYEPSDELVKEIQNHVKHATAPYKYPRVVEFVRELPKTSSGKIMRTAIRAADMQKLQNEGK